MARVGIVGAGQLARMTQQAAISLGVEVVVLGERADTPAVRAGATLCAGRPDRLADLIRLADLVDVVTLEHERTPADLLERLAALGYRVAPGAAAARLGRDKAEARAVLAARGIPVAPWLLTHDLAAIDAFGTRHGWPLFLKAPTGGYDGRGVWRVASPDEAARVVGSLGRDVLVEPTIPIRHELSVLVVRSARGEVAAYPAVETVQRDGQCHEVFVPASVPDGTADAAHHLALRIAEAVGLVGTMAVELFVTGEGLLFNELAVRPHNSGHLSIEACTTSQFENHLRATIGLPLGATDLRVPAAAMVNVVGGPDGSDPFARLTHGLAVPGASVHRYAKEAWPNRKLGHVTATGSTVTVARATAARAVAALNGERAA